MALRGSFLVAVWAAGILCLQPVVPFRLAGHGAIRPPSGPRRFKATTRAPASTTTTPTEGTTPTPTTDSPKLSAPPRALCDYSANLFWRWRGQDVRYTRAGPARTEAESKGAVVFVHGLFVNADHWRRTAPALAAEGYEVFAIDLLGSGYSSKPSPRSPDVWNGEDELDEIDAVAEVAYLGTARGTRRRQWGFSASSETFSVPQRHPLGSPYNFYTWAAQLEEFIAEIVLHGVSEKEASVALVCNSIGCISGLLAAKRCGPDIINGCHLVAPNFRELHVAEVSPAVAMPALRQIQATLRGPAGKALFDALANKAAVKAILREPYYNQDAVDDPLVDALLTPLLLPGASDVVFDALSYSAGPLPEQLLQDPALRDVPVWVSVGDRDPWTPVPRVQALSQFAPVQRVDVLRECGHCPHDERPDVVNPLLCEFLEAVFSASSSSSSDFKQ